MADETTSQDAIPADDALSGTSGDDALPRGGETLSGGEADTDALVSRDERMDSIDPATGALTAEAVALRQAARAEEG